MSDEQNNPQPTEPEPEGSPSSPAPSTQPTPEPQAQEEPKPAGTLKGAGLRYTEQDGVPSWAVGKTADELLQMTQTLYQSVLSDPQSTPQGAQNGAPQGTPQSTPQPQPQPTQNLNAQNGAGTPSPPDPDLIYENKAEYQRQLAEWQRHVTQSAVQSASQPILAPLARMARQQSQGEEKYKDVWTRYAPEIDAVMKTVPEQNRTNPDLWNQAAEMVAGRHWKELARAEAEQIAASPPDSGTIPAGGVTQTGAPSGASADPIEKLFREDHPAIQKFKRLGKGAREIREHAARMGHTSEDYAKILKERAAAQWTASGTPKRESEAQHAAAVPAMNS